MFKMFFLCNYTHVKSFFMSADTFLITAVLIMDISVFHLSWWTVFFCLSRVRQFYLFWLYHLIISLLIFLLSWNILWYFKACFGIILHLVYMFFPSIIIYFYNFVDIPVWHSQYAEIASYWLLSDCSNSRYILQILHLKLLASCNVLVHVQNCWLIDIFDWGKPTAKSSWWFKMNEIKITHK